MILHDYNHSWNSDLLRDSFTHLKKLFKYAFPKVKERGNMYINLHADDVIYSIFVASGKWPVPQRHKERHEETPDKN